MKLVVAAALVLSLQIEPRNAKAVVDGDALLFSFELTAAGAPAVKSVEYSVSIEGTPLFSGSVQGFEMLVAGFGDPQRSRIALIAMTGKPQFEYRVRGIVHTLGEDGAVADVPFSVTGLCATPEELARPKKKVSHSLLSY